ncbi:MAG: hypothetical protein ABIJ61_11495 [bacterium]
MILATLICAVLILAANLVSPFWWWLMLVPFMFGLIVTRRVTRAFLVGAIAGGLVWFGASVYYWKSGGEIVTQRVAEILQLNVPELLILAAGLIGFLAGGFSAAAGAAIRALLSNKPTAQKTLPS